MAESPQNLYAKSLRQPYGYPLRCPEPGPGLPPSYAEHGLQIGDVGYVDDEGMFQVLFNICLPPDHELHRGRPELTRLVGLTKFNSDEAHPITNAIPPTAAPICHGIQSPPNRDRLRRSTSYSTSGAFLILPSGAAHQRLTKGKEGEFYELAEKYALDWCQFVGRQSLYLITGFYKTMCWRLGSFHDVWPAGRVIVECDSTGNCDVRSNCDYRQSADNHNGRENQTVLISGFKIQVRGRYNNVQIEKLSSHSKSIWVSLAHFILLNMFYLRRLMANVHVIHAPSLSQPFHPSDVINGYLLDKYPDARVAITHDDQWLSMLEENKLSHEVMLDDKYFRTFLEEKYRDGTYPDNAVYLRRKMGVPSFFVPVVAYEARRFVVTRMRAENIVTCLRPMPVGFYVIIQSNATVRRSKCNPASLRDNIIEWDDEIVLPTDLMVNVQFSIIASFEFEPPLGNGKTLCMLEKSMDKLAVGEGTHFLFSRIGGNASSCPSLLLTLEEQRFDSFPDRGHVGSNSGCEIRPPIEVVEETDKGHDALFRYHEGREAEKLKECLECFKLALDHCPPGDKCRAAALFNLATARFIRYQVRGIVSDLDEVIASYRRALCLRPGHHPDRPRTLLHLAQALLHRQGKLQYESSVGDEIERLATEIKSICSESRYGYDHQAADLVVQTLKLYRVLTSGKSADLDELVSELHWSAQISPDWHFDRPYRLTNFSIALRKRFEITDDLDDIEKSISAMEQALQLVSEGHFDKPWMLASLGDARRLRFLRRGGVADLYHSISMIEDAIELLPEGHADKPGMLVSLGAALRARFIHRGNIADLDKSISLIEQAVEPTPDRHFDKPGMLISLGDALRARSVQRGNVTDILRSISMIEQAVRLTPDGHFDKLRMLVSLGHSFRVAVNMLEDLGDNAMNTRQYDEAISLYSTTLSLNPTDLLGLFYKRSKACEANGLWEDALSDACKVITLAPSSPLGYERKHMALRGAGRHEDALDAFETMLLKMLQSHDPEIRDRYNQYVKTKEIVRGVIQKVISDSPRVLISTTSGRLCNKSEQATAFESLPVFTELILSTTTPVDHSRIEREVTKYYRYATFSHKWEDNEPLFEEVIHITVYDLQKSRTHDKLRMFCNIVRDAGLHWAWSDTCCINKADHHVLQEALVLMFKWYEGSDLTIVFLLGVRFPSQRGDLVKSTWNKRAWTLQEYHASKESSEIVSEMEEATGVSARALMALRPGLDNVREKLRLAAIRQTMRVEDKAYSLFGIFSISLPVMYGEGDKALGRLLAQLLASSGDASILAWAGKSGSFNSCLPVDIAVFSRLQTTHIPQTIESAELDAIASSLLTLPDLPLVMELYDRLDKVPVPFFVGQRMKLPCITFKLGPVCTQEGSACVFRARTTALGIVEINTQEDLSRFDPLYLVHPWINFLLGRQPDGSVTNTILEENASVHSPRLGKLLPCPGTSANDAVSLVPQMRTALGRLTTAMEDVEYLRPPSSPSEMEKQMQAFRAVARLRQPFGALLLTPHLRNVAAYRKVAAESLIMVQVGEITPEILYRLVNSVCVLDVL